MNLKYAINKSLGRLGYTITRVRAPTAASTASEKPIGQDTHPPQRTKQLSVRPAKNEPPRVCSFLANTTARQQNDPAKQKIDEFHQNGVVVLPTDANLAIHWRETEIVERDVSNVHSSWDWAGNSIKPYSDVLQTGIPSESLKYELLKLITSPYYEAFFNGVLGCSVSIGNCRLVKSLAHASAGVGPQSWHEDGCPPGIIRGVLYLTDVSEFQRTLPV